MPSYSVRVPVDKRDKITVAKSNFALPHNLLANCGD